MQLAVHAAQGVQDAGGHLQRARCGVCELVHEHLRALAKAVVHVVHADAACTREDVRAWESALKLMRKASVTEQSIA